MAKDITISTQPNLDLTIATVEPGRPYTVSHLESQLQTLLDNDSASDTKLTTTLTIGQDKVIQLHLAPNSVTTINIQDGVITGDKIAPGTIENTKIAPGTIDETKLNITNTPTAGQYLTAGSNNNGTWLSVTAGTNPVVIADASINISHLDSTSRPRLRQLATAGPSDNFTYIDETNPMIAPLSIVENMLRDSSVGTINIQDKSVTTDKIVDAAITGSHIIPDSITSGRIQSNAIDTSKINTISVGYIQRGAFTADKLIDGTFNEDRLSLGGGDLSPRQVPSPGDWLTATIGDNFRYIKALSINTFITPGSIGLNKLKAVNRRPVPGNLVIAGSNDDFDFEPVPTALGGDKLNVISTWFRRSNAGLAFRRGKQVWFFVLLQGTRLVDLRGTLIFPGTFSFQVPYFPSAGVSNKIFCQSVQQLNHLDSRWVSSMVLTVTTSGASIDITTGYSSQLITVPGDKLVIASGMYFTN